MCRYNWYSAGSSGWPFPTKLDHTRNIKYHTLKYVRIVKKIKYAYDTRIIRPTQVGKNAALYFLLTYTAFLKSMPSLSSSWRHTVVVLIINCFATEAVRTSAKI